MNNEKKKSGFFDIPKHLSIFGAFFLIKQGRRYWVYSPSLTLSCSSMALRMTNAESLAIWSWVSVTEAPWSTITTMCLDWGRTADTYTGLQENRTNTHKHAYQDQTWLCNCLTYLLTKYYVFVFLFHPFLIPWLSWVGFVPVSLSYTFSTHTGDIYPKPCVHETSYNYIGNFQKLQMEFYFSVYVYVFLNYKIRFSEAFQDL